MLRLFISSILLLSLLCTSISCQSQEPGELTKINILSKMINEASGLTFIPEALSIYTINDSGNSPSVYELDLKGNIKRVIDLFEIKNIDWEDLTYDNQGNIFIGDFGNNNNDRKDLTIYQINPNSEKVSILKEIPFSLEDQKNFPPKKKKRNFDIEAFIRYKEGFFLFTKNRSSDFEGTTKIYYLEDNSPTHEAKLVHSFKTCKDDKDCFVTGAAINKAKNKIVLLTYNKIFILKNFENDFSSVEIEKIKLDHYSQKEGACFINDSTLYIVDEGQGNDHSSLYQYNLKD